MSDFSNEKEIEIIRSLVNKDSITLDLGANVGIFTKVLAENSKHVYAFEPDPDNFKQLKQNTKHLQNVNLYNVALSNQYDDHGILYRSQINNGMHRMYPSKLCEGGKQILNVLTITIDSIIPSFEKKIDFIKIDVEGYEYYVILGMRNLITRDKPSIIMEFHPDSIRESGGDPKTLYDIMSELFNYSYPIHCISGESLDTYKKLEEVTNTPKGGVNILWQK